MRLAVAGWPVSHSRSPEMQNAALAAAGLADWHYGRLPVAPALFAETVAALPPRGFRGLNVTIPHKAAALALAQTWAGGVAVSEPAQAIGAANTLVFETDGTLRVDNTDAPGLLAALPVPVAGRRALVLGAGGSARAAVWALCGAGAQVEVWNRSPERARALCAELGGTPATRPGPANLLVNCTSVGLTPQPDELNHLPIDPARLSGFEGVVDFVYRPGGTALQRAAAACGVPVLDGLELLVAQGALSFELFTGRAAPVAAMRQAVGLDGGGRRQGSG